MKCRIGSIELAGMRYNRLDEEILDKAAMIIDAKSKLVMIGDSITDCGRLRPLAAAPQDLGNGYVSLVDALLRATFPSAGLRIVNMGNGGDTVRELKVRWQSDVVALKPDWLSIMIGINDVWRHFDNIAMPAGQVSIEEYRRTLDELIRKTLPGLKGLILLTPYYIESNPQDPMRAMMDSYGDVVRHLADKYDAALVDTQAAMDVALQAAPALSLSPDRVHPGLTGHMILARAFLKAIEYNW